MISHHRVERNSGPDYLLLVHIQDFYPVPAYIAQHKSHSRPLEGSRSTGHILHRPGSEFRKVLIAVGLWIRDCNYVILGAFHCTGQLKVEPVASGDRKIEGRDTGRPVRHIAGRSHYIYELRLVADIQHELSAFLRLGKAISVRHDHPRERVLSAFDSSLDLSCLRTHAREYKNKYSDE